VVFFKKLFPSQEETLERIAKLQQEEKVLSLQERVFSKKEKLQKSVSGLRKKKFGRSLAGRGLKALGKVGATALKEPGKFDVNIFGSTGPKKKSKKKPSDDPFKIDLGF